MPLNLRNINNEKIMLKRLQQILRNLKTAPKRFIRLTDGDLSDTDSDQDVVSKDTASPVEPGMLKKTLNFFKVFFLNAPVEFASTLHPDLQTSSMEEEVAPMDTEIPSPSQLDFSDDTDDTDDTFIASNTEQPKKYRCRHSRRRPAPC